MSVLFIDIFIFNLTFFILIIILQNDLPRILKYAPFSARISLLNASPISRNKCSRFGADNSRWVPNMKNTVNGAAIQPWIRAILPTFHNKCFFQVKNWSKFVQTSNAIHKRDSYSENRFLMLSFSCKIVNTFAFDIISLSGICCNFTFHTRVFNSFGSPTDLVSNQKNHPQIVDICVEGLP